MYSLRTIILSSIIFMIFFYIRSKLGHDYVIRVPKIISIIFGAPKGVGKMPLLFLLTNIGTIISLLVGLFVYFFIDKEISTLIYMYTFLALGCLSLIIEAIYVKYFA